MDSAYESSDILASTNKPIIRPSAGAAAWSKMSTVFQVSAIAGLALASWFLFLHLKVYVKKWQEKSYRLAMRRRHGIPDDDHRPFNVAFAAASRAQKDREARERRNALAPPPSGQDHTTTTASSRVSKPPAPGADGMIRQRLTADSRSELKNNVVPSWVPASRREPANVKLFDQDRLRRTGNGPASLRAAEPPLTVDYANRYNANVSPSRSQPQLPDTSRLNRKGKKNVDWDHAPSGTGEARKHGLTDTDAEEPELAKRSRVEGEELIDGDEHASWHDRDGAKCKRGSKRVASPEDDDEVIEGRKRDKSKRARKVSGDKFVPAPHGEDEEMGDEITEMESIPRGKKRDRAEAGSTFGGDEEISEEGEGVEETEEEEKVERRRKRRTMQRRKSEQASSSSRGRKRDRDVGSDGESDMDSTHELEEEETGHHRRKSSKAKSSSRKKRGKKSKSGSDSDEGDADTSMNTDRGGEDDGVMVSTDKLCKGRKIGEEWETGGVTYKVGPNGQRLRQELVKKAKTKYSMPRDSEHPDKSANFEVFVEVWLTEEEYKAAKERGELAWQDTPHASPKASVEPETPGNVPDSPSKAGKNLLWSSTSTRESPAPRRSQPFRQSVATNLGLRINPFQQSTSNHLQQHQQPSRPGRRVTSAYNTPPLALALPSENLSGSTNSPTTATRSPFRSFSKWEKQDLEAEAMAKMRQRVQEQKKKEEAKNPPAPLKPAATLPAVASAPSVLSGSAPALTFALPPTAEKPASGGETKPTPPLFSLPPAPTPVAPTPAPSSEPAKTEQPKPASSAPLLPSFSLPSAPSPSPFGIPAPASQNASDANKPKQAAPLPFSLKPAQPSQSKPSFFAPPASTTSAPAPSAPPAPSAFSFGPPPASKPQGAPASSVPNFFGNKGFGAPTSGAPAAPTAPSGTSSPAQVQETSKPMFSFGITAPSSGAPSTTSAAPASAPPATQSQKDSKPSFSFGVNGSNPPSTNGGIPSFFGTGPQASKPPLSIFGAAQTEQKKPEEAKADEGAAPGGSSLLSRVGGFGAPAAGASAGNGNTFSWGNNNGFSALANGAQTAKPVSAFGGPSMQTSSNGTPSAPANGAAEAPKPKFNFGMPASGRGSPSLITQPEAPKPATSPSTFGGFGAPQTPAPAGNSSAPTSFGFGGTTSTPAATTTTPSQPQQPPKFGFGMSTTPAASPSGASIFGGGGPLTSGNTVAVFGDSSVPKPATSAPTFPFGGGGTAAPKNNEPSNPMLSFGDSGASAKPAETAKLSFAFGPASSTPATSTGPGGLLTPSATDGAHKSPFSFASTSSSTPTNPTSSFGFSAHPSTGGLSGASTTPAPGNPPSMFGNPSNSTPSTFGFTQPSTGAFAFGKPASSEGQK
ncbi:hypothetical protein JAAARDRAFT_27801 [Jaapia argillacea MUCL 33604]|uniref:Uncharacterized protein n=1 Tax=Jaapia argillacea MUCL 33604 TaxID=933084 RepID=A0A067QB36_9AGAM|nr:hypothetical protein JAAARDRAFT_27801 [Jaapia argillacea MUCL 33604]